MKKLICLLFISVYSFAQYNTKDSNRIGIQAGITYGNIFSAKIKSNSQIGWTAGIHLRGNLYNDFQAVYGMNFSDLNLNVPATDLNGNNTEIQYKLSSVQFMFLPSYMVVENRFNLEGGIIVQVNDRFKINENYREYIVKDNNNVSFRAKDIARIPLVNPGLYLGINVGVTNVRVRAGYTFFVTRLNSDFGGNLGQATAALVIYM